MWNAIKSDLFDFVATIQEDTTKSLNKVLGELTEEGDDEATILAKKAADVRRSFESYGTPIKDKKLKEYQSFLKTFNLGAFANDIATVLDEEPEVSRFYAELVPSQITPEEFWARLFFRLNMVYRAGNTGLNLEDEEEEEELSWDAEPSGPADTNATSAAEASAHGSVGGGSLGSNVQSASDLKAVELKDENDRLKSVVKTLTGRVTDLEKQLATALKENEAQAKLITSLRANALLAEGEAAQKATASSSHDNKAAESGNNADNVSQCSGDSGIVLHNSDTMSFPDEDSRHGLTSAPVKPGNGAANSASGSTAAAASSITSKTTRAYLAAVDDNEEDPELDGWS